MVGHLSCIFAKVNKDEQTDITSQKKTAPEIHEVIVDVIKIVNNIRHKTLFESFCEKFGSKYTHFLLHADMRLLSRDKI